MEFWWPFPVAVPADADVDAFVTAIQDAGVQLTGLNFFAGDMAGGDRGLVSWKSRTSEFVDNLDVVAGIGEDSIRAFNALYGLEKRRVHAERRHLGSDLRAPASLRPSAARVLEPFPARRFP